MGNGGGNRRKAFQSRDALCHEETERLLPVEETSAGGGSPGPTRSRGVNADYCRLTIADETTKPSSSSSSAPRNNDDDDNDDDRRRRHHNRSHHRHSIPSQIPAQALEELNVRSLTRLPFPVSEARTFLTDKTFSLRRPTSKAVAPLRPPPLQPTRSPAVSFPLPPPPPYGPYTSPAPRENCFLRDGLCAPSGVKTRPAEVASATAAERHLVGPATITPRPLASDRATTWSNNNNNNNNNDANSNNVNIHNSTVLDADGRILRTETVVTPCWNETDSERRNSPGKAAPHMDRSRIN